MQEPLEDGSRQKDLNKHSKVIVTLQINMETDERNLFYITCFQWLQIFCYLLQFALHANKFIIIFC